MYNLSRSYYVVVLLLALFGLEHFAFAETTVPLGALAAQRERYEETFAQWGARGYGIEGRQAALDQVFLLIDEYQHVTQSQIRGDLIDRVRAAQNIDAEAMAVQQVYTAMNFDIAKQYIDELDALVQDSEGLALMSNDSSTWFSAREYLRGARSRFQEVMQRVGDGPLTTQDASDITGAIWNARSAHDALKVSQTFTSIVAGIEQPGEVLVPGSNVVPLAPRATAELQQQYLRYLDAFERAQLPQESGSGVHSVLPLVSPCTYISYAECRALINNLPSLQQDQLQFLLPFDAIHEQYISQINFQLTDDSNTLLFLGGPSSYTEDTTPEMMQLKQREQELQNASRTALEAQKERLTQATDMSALTAYLENGGPQELNASIAEIQNQKSILSHETLKQFDIDVRSHKVKLPEYQPGGGGGATLPR